MTFVAEATHVSSTELLFNWLPLLGATERGSSALEGDRFCPSKTSNLSWGAREQ